MLRRRPVGLQPRQRSIPLLSFSIYCSVCEMAAKKEWEVRTLTRLFLSKTPKIYMYVQTVEVTQTILCFPWKLTLSFIKLIAIWKENIAKRLMRLKIRIFIVNINVVLQTCGSKEGQFYRFSHQHNCFQLRSHKKCFQGFSTPLLVF